MEEESMTPITKKEAKRIWEMANAFQIQMYERIVPHLKAIETMYGDIKATSQWLRESVRENDQLNTIKAKMEIVINTPEDK
jgi:hypothetical protein